MRTSCFLLFRLNLVDRQDLFPKPIPDDFSLVKVFQVATTNDFDVIRRGRRSEYRWALREAVLFGDGDEDERPFLMVTLSRESMSRRGPIITSDGISHGVSTFQPPPATLVRLLVDLKRHIIAVEDVPSVIHARSGWRTAVQTILDKAAWYLQFTSVLRLNPIVPAKTISDRVSTLDRITRVRVTLTIPNPDLGPSFKRLFEEMQEGGVRELTQDMRNERGLNVGVDTLPRAVLDMATTGYRKGAIRVNGYADGKKQDLVFGEDVARVEIDEPDGLDDLQGFIEGYASGSRSTAVKRFAKAIVNRIDEYMGH